MGGRIFGDMSAFLLNYLVNCAAFQSENMKIMEPEEKS